MTTTDTLDLPAPPSGHPQRFVTRWRFIGVGISNVWWYGHTPMPAPSGRLLLRGTNGVGKTTMLEALWPYLLDLDAAKMNAGKGRGTTLSRLMSDGATGKRRTGYVWMSFADADGTQVSYGVRLQYSESASPKVTVVPFTTLGIPGVDMDLYDQTNTPLAIDAFTHAVTETGGMVFDANEAYVAHIAERMWGGTARSARELAKRVRTVRNPALLKDTTPGQAAAALAEALPNVDESTLAEIGDALAASDDTRAAFARDTAAADAIDEFANAWAAHVTDVLSKAHSQAVQASDAVSSARRVLSRARTEHTRAQEHEDATTTTVSTVSSELAATRGQLAGIESSEAYRAAGLVAELKNTASAEARTAATAWDRLLDAEQAYTRAHSRDAADAASLLDAVRTLTAEASAAHPQAATAQGQLLAVTDLGALTLNVGTARLTTGPRVQVNAEIDALDSLAGQWDTLARDAAARADSAKLARRKYQEVSTAGERAERAEHHSRNAEANRDAVSARAQSASRDLTVASTAHVGAVEAWWTGPVCTPLSSTHDGLLDIDELRSLDPGDAAAVLDAHGEWARLAGDAASYLRAQHQAAANAERSAAREARQDADAARQRAAQLRGGTLLSLPRPSWDVTEADQDEMFGSALEWATDDATIRDGVEGALGALGALGARLSRDGVATTSWSVALTGPVITPNLTQVLAAGPPGRAELVTALLERIGFGSDAAATGGAPASVWVDADGHFAAGVLTGTLSPQQATHIGAASRLAAAAAEAERLDAQAVDLEATATAHEATARGHEDSSGQVRAAEAAMPSPDPIRRAEAAREHAARAAAAAHEAATEATEAAIVARREARASLAEWTERTSAASLPPDPDALGELEVTSRATAEVLTRCRRTLVGQVRERLVRLGRESSSADAATRLRTAHAQANATAEQSAVAAGKYEAVLASAGQAAEEALARHQQVTTAIAELVTAEGDARAAQLNAVADAERAAAAVQTRQEALAAAQPAAVHAGVQVRSFLAAAGVRAALGLVGLQRAPDLAPTDPDAQAHELAELLTELGSALAGRKAIGPRALGDRYDLARAALTGMWNLERGDGVDVLDTYVLTHDGHSYNPIDAQIHASAVREDAAAALGKAEEAALREYVIGRLPGAIGRAWAEMYQWVADANAAMRSASASSGVGVQIKLSLSRDLSPEQRVVHELACKVADWERTSAQKEQIGKALASLIVAADGEDVHSRLRAAVDISSWVDVSYLVTRPGAEPVRWGSRTGLSNGESRLVVMAPMVAALAAWYNKARADGLRLVALDEIPAEVDDAGREGLARYVAELDLDLIATSYTWDGAPGATDGIDCWDLEKASDGTVVAYPMLIRGLDAVPGDVHV